MIKRYTLLFLTIATVVMLLAGFTYALPDQSVVYTMDICQYHGCWPPYPGPHPWPHPKPWPDPYPLPYPWPDPIFLNHYWE
jgi:hypothetical protein